MFWGHRAKWNQIKKRICTSYEAFSILIKLKKYECFKTPHQKGTRNQLFINSDNQLVNGIFIYTTFFLAFIGVVISLSYCINVHKALF